MNAKFFLLCSMIVFSDNTEAAQEPVFDRTVTIVNQLKHPVYIRTNTSESVISATTSLGNPDIIKSFEKKEILVASNTIGYTKVVQNDSCSKMVTADIVNDEQRITIGKGENELVLRERK